MHWSGFLEWSAVSILLCTSLGCVNGRGTGATVVRSGESSSNDAGAESSPSTDESDEVDSPWYDPLPDDDDFDEADDDYYDPGGFDGGGDDGWNDDQDDAAGDDGGFEDDNDDYYDDGY